MQAALIFVNPLQHADWLSGLVLPQQFDIHRRAFV